MPDESVIRAIIECATDAIVTIDDKSTILSANASVDRIFGYSPDELVGQSLTVLMPPELRTRHLAAMARFQASGARSFPWQAVRLPGLRKDGQTIELEISFGQCRPSRRQSRRLFSRRSEGAERFWMRARSRRSGGRPCTSGVRSPNSRNALSRHARAREVCKSVWIVHDCCGACSAELHIGDTMPRRVLRRESVA